MGSQILCVHFTDSAGKDLKSGERRERRSVYASIVHVLQVQNSHGSAGFSCFLFLHHAGGPARRCRSRVKKSVCSCIGGKGFFFLFLVKNSFLFLLCIILISRCGFCVVLFFFRSVDKSVIIYETVSIAQCKRIH